MNILVTNDDGINAEGIKRFVEVLAEAGDVYVFAPAHQMSGMSHSINITNHVYMEEHEIPNTKAAISLTGTPADCVKFGIQWMRQHGLTCDQIFSGINMGSNLGTDTQYSGTVGAAAEGAIYGIKSAAVSVDGHFATHFDVAAELSVDLIPFMQDKMPGNVILNINVPDLPREEIKGVLATSLGGASFINDFILREDGGYSRGGDQVDNSGKPLSLDVGAAANDYATITPLQFDFTARETISVLKENIPGIR